MFGVRCYLLVSFLVHQWVGGTAAAAGVGAVSMHQHKFHRHLTETQKDGNVLGGPRIIGGSNATSGRFPYYVGLWNRRSDLFNCGGSLIAPDVVLTAAHCWGGQYRTWVAQVGRYDLANPSDNFESFRIAKYLPHPYYGVESWFSSDYMLLFLNGTSSTPPLKINNDATVPQNGQDIGVIGLGVAGTVEDGYIANAHFPDILQETTLQAVPKNVCERATNGNITYEGMVTNDSLCAWSEGKAYCNGDSGGPLTVKGSTADQDVQVGIVSWSYGCYNPIFPDVSARVSEGADWIAANVCKYSKNPPAYFNCQNSTASAAVADPIVPTNPVLPGETVAVTVELVFDYSPQETWWFILNSAGDLVYIVPRYTYGFDHAGKTVKQVLYLPVGETYTFVIKDEGENGIYDGGFRVRLGSKGRVLASDFSFYSVDSRKKFTLLSSYSMEPTPSPTISKAPSVSPAPTLPLQTVTVTINFADNYQPYNFGYSFLNSTGDVVQARPIGSFGYENITVEEVVQLPKGEYYTFVFSGNDGDLYPGNYSLTIGSPNAGGPVIVSSNDTPVASNDTPVASNDTPVASNNTLVANNDTLVASNDTLAASNDTLAASNDTLVASNDNLVASNDTLVASNETLVASNETLVASDDALRNTTYSNTYEKKTRFFLSGSFSAVPSITPSSSPSLAPTVTPQPTGHLQPLTLTIDFAYHDPLNFGYVLVDGRQRVIYNETYETFLEHKQTVERVLHVPSEQRYTFWLVSDVSNFYPGNFSIALGKPHERGPVLAATTTTSASGFGSEGNDDGFGSDDYHFNVDLTNVTFYVPSTYSAVPSMAPVASAAVTLSIDFADFPSEIGYRIVNDFGVYIVDVPFGTFGFANKTLQQVINLPSESEYTFVIRDFYGDGRFPGRFSLVLGTPGAVGRTIVSKTGIQGHQEEYRFSFSSSAPVSVHSSARPSRVSRLSRVPVQSPVVSSLLSVPTARPSYSHRPSWAFGGTTDPSPFGPSSNAPDGSSSSFTNRPTVTNMPTIDLSGTGGPTVDLAQSPTFLPTASVLPTTAPFGGSSVSDPPSPTVARPSTNRPTVTNMPTLLIEFDETSAPIMVSYSLSPKASTSQTEPTYYVASPKSKKGLTTAADQGKKGKGLRSGK